MIMRHLANTLLTLMTGTAHIRSHPWRANGMATLQRVHGKMKMISISSSMQAHTQVTLQWCSRNRGSPWGLMGSPLGTAGEGDAIVGPLHIPT